MATLAGNVFAESTVTFEIWWDVGKCSATISDISIKCSSMWKGFAFALLTLCKMIVYASLLKHDLPRTPTPNGHLMHCRLFSQLCTPPTPTMHDTRIISSVTALLYSSSPIYDYDQ